MLKDIINNLDRNIQFLGKLFKSRFLGLIHHNFHHLLSDEFSLRAFGVASCSDLSTSSLSEANAKHSEQVSVNSFGLNEGFNSGVPFLDNGAEFVSGDVHSVEVGIAIKAFNFFDLYLHLSPGEIIAISIQISQRYFKHTTF
jgi:hypothetical protein